MKIYRDSNVFAGQPHPMKRRTIMCVDFKENAIADASCNDIGDKPSEMEPCENSLPLCYEDNNENSNMI